MSKCSLNVNIQEETHRVVLITLQSFKIQLSADLKYFICVQYKKKEREKQLKA